MSRRTPIKELMQEESVPGSPRRKSTRIAAKLPDEKEVSTPRAKIVKGKRTSLSQEGAESQKDDDERSVSSNASSVSTRRITRAASKSPTMMDTPGTAARRTRASSTSSLRDITDEVISSPVPKKTSRRSTRSMSMSPSAELEELNIVPGTPHKLRSLTTPPATDMSSAGSGRVRGRRTSTSEKTPLESIEETESKNEETKELESQNEVCDQNDINLPFKKKRKALNLQTIEEKSFIEDIVDKSIKETEVKDTVVQVLYPKLSLSLSKNKLTVKEFSEERELKVVLRQSELKNIEIVNPKATVEDNDLVIETNREVQNKTNDILDDSVFNSSSEPESLKLLEPILQSTIDNTKSSEIMLPDSTIGELKTNETYATLGMHEVESHAGVATETMSDAELHNQHNKNPQGTDIVIPVSSSPSSKQNENSIPKKSLSDTERSTQISISKDNDELNQKPQDTDLVIPASPTSPSTKQKENSIYEKSLSDTEQSTKVSKDQSKLGISTNVNGELDGSSSNNDLTLGMSALTDEKQMNQAALNVSGSSDSSDKENKKQLNTDSMHKPRSKSISGDISIKMKDSSFFEPMEVEYASDVDKTVCSMTPELSKRRLSCVLQKTVKENSLISSTPKKGTQRDEKISESKSENDTELECVGAVANIENSSSTLDLNTISDSNKSKMQPNIVEAETITANAPESSVADTTIDMVEEDSVLDYDEYEENHPSIIHSSDEEAAEKEQKTYSKTLPTFKLPDSSKGPILSEETYNALVNVDNDSDQSDDPDFHLSAANLSFSINSDRDKSFKDLNAKIDDLIAKHEGGESSSEESVTHFLDDFAEEGEEDTPSEGSNDIIEEGVSIGSSDSDSIASEDAYENDSFIDDSEDDELLPGEGDDLGQDKKPKQRSRIIAISDSDDNDFLVNGEIDDDLEKMSTQANCDSFPPSVISVQDSPIEENERVEEGTVCDVLINMQDNLQSLEEIKQVSPAKQMLDIKETPKTDNTLTIASTPNNSLAEVSPEHRIKVSSLNIQTNITVEDMAQGGISDRINKVIDAFYLGVKDRSLNASDSFSLNVSIDCIKTPTKENVQKMEERKSSIRHEEKENECSSSLDFGFEPPHIPSEKKPQKVKKLKSNAQSQEATKSTKKPTQILAAEQHSPDIHKIEKRKSSNFHEGKDGSRHASLDFDLGLPHVPSEKKPKKVKKQKHSVEFEKPTKSSKKLATVPEIISKIPVAQKEKSQSSLNKNQPKVKSKREYADEVVDILPVQSSSFKLPNITVESADKEEKPKKKRFQLQESDIEKKVRRQKTILEKQAGEDSDESDMSTDLDIKKYPVEKCHLVDPTKSKPSRKRKLLDPLEVLVVEQVKKTKHDKVLPKITKTAKVPDSQRSEWVVEKSNISYFPSSIKLQDREVKAKEISKVVSKPKFVPSTSDDRKSWGYTRAKNMLPSAHSEPSPADYTERFSSKDFKNKMLFNPYRVAREDMKTYLKKKEKTKP